MKVAIVGFEVEGRAAYAYWRTKGADITICDIDPGKETPPGVATQLGEAYLRDLEHFDLIVRSAGVHPDLILKLNPTVAEKITTVVNEFLRVCPTKQVIGITGTKGKGTTSTLITRILEAVGRQVFLGGNIGTAPLDFLDKLTKDSWVVLELSSFQLYDLRSSPPVAVCLTMGIDHLNWHADARDYINAKSNLFRFQSPNDLAIYFAKNNTSKEIADLSPGRKIPYFAPPGAHIQDNVVVIDGQKICRTDELKLVGRHNWENVCAAITVAWQITKDVESIRNAVTNFVGLEHRLQLIGEVSGVRYYDDSFGTTPETAIAAIESFNEPQIIILGGSDKGASFDKLAHCVATSTVRTAIVIGETGPKIEAALRRAGFATVTQGGATMSEIVHTAHGIAQPGDIVLLSTACASFDMFTDYKDRGEQFATAVKSL